jgi:cyanophycinase
MSEPRPLYLLADSQLLFLKQDGRLLLEAALDTLPAAGLTAAYLGASNGDLPEYFELFQAAMEGLGIRASRMISSAYTPEERAALEQADLIVLGGGDVARGWQVFQETGLHTLIPQRYQAGAVLVGVSAGAVQLGRFGWPEENRTPERLFTTFGIVPAVVGVHEERDDWAVLREVVRMLGGAINGIGIPAGGGAIYHPDQTLVPIRYPLVEFQITESGERRAMGWPSPDDR